MKDFKWLPVSNVIFDIFFYLNINFVGRNVILNNEIWNDLKKFKTSVSLVI